MNEGFNSFIFYKEWIDQLVILARDPEEMSSFCDGLKSFLDGQEAEDLSPMAALVFNQMTAQILRDKSQYEEISKARSAAGKKGAEAKRSKAKQNEAKQSKMKQEEAKASLKEDEDDNDNNNTTSTSVDVVCSDVILTFPLAKGKDFEVTQQIYNMLAECYPNVDTMAQLKKLKAWSISNPKRRKVDGMKFLNNWFSWEQDKGKPERPTIAEIHQSPIIDPFAELRGAT